MHILNKGVNTTFEEGLAKNLLKSQRPKHVDRPKIGTDINNVRHLLPIQRKRQVLLLARASR